MPKRRADPPLPWEERQQKEKEARERRGEEQTRGKAMLAAKDVEFHKQLIDKIACLEGGRLEFDVEADEIGTDYVYSSYTNVYGFRFRIGCRRMGPQGNLTGCLFCDDNNAMDTDYSLQTHVNLKFEAPGKPVHAVLNAAQFSRSDLLNIWDLKGYRHLHSNCIVHNGRVRVQADIKVVACYKSCDTERIMYSIGSTDVTLVVGRKKFPQNKNYLAYFSGYFKVLFESDFAERDKAKIELKDIDVKDFQNLLDLITTYRYEFKPSAVIGILRMADFFDVGYARMKCVEFLMETRAFTRSAKLVLSEQFRLTELQYWVFQDIFVKHCSPWLLVNSQDFASLSETMQTLLLLIYIRRAYYEGPNVDYSVPPPNVGFWLAPDWMIRSLFL